jgi:hypothetical protein
MPKKYLITNSNISKVQQVLLLLFIVFGIKDITAQVCGPINGLYQTIGNATTLKTEIHKYNYFAQDFLKITELPIEATNFSGANAAYNTTTQYLYSSNRSNNSSGEDYTIRVYNPAANYAHIGSITIAPSPTKPFNNTLFSKGNLIGYLNGDRLITFDVTGIATYPATIVPTEVTVDRD